jgi:AcrR family transcriptional regulator
MPAPGKRKPTRRRGAPAAAGSPASARPRGRPARADRAGLLDAAERAIRRSGPGISLERIAAKAGVTKPVLFSHVGDRRALVDALADRVLGRIEVAARSAVASAAPGRPSLEAMLRASLETIAADRHLYAFVNGAGGGDTTLAGTLEFARRSAAPIIAGTRQGRLRAGLDAAAAESWGYAIVGMLHMVGIWWLSEPARELDAAQLAAQLTDLLWGGLALPGAPGALATS